MADESTPSVRAVAARWSLAALLLAVAALLLALPTVVWGLGFVLAGVSVTIAVSVRQGLGRRDRLSTAALTIAGIAAAAHFVLYALALLA
jgi:hypothetical protein